MHVPVTPRETARDHALGFIRSPDGRDATLVSSGRTRFSNPRSPTLQGRGTHTPRARADTGPVRSQRLFQYALRLTLTLQSRTRRRKAHGRLLAVVSLLAAIRRVAALHRLLASIPGLARWQSLPLGDGNKAPGPSADSNWLDVAARVACEALDVAALVAGNIYLFSRLGLVPLPVHVSRRADRLSDGATLLAAGIGLASVARKRHELYRLGKQARRRAIEAESKLDELDFWEDRIVGGRIATAGANRDGVPLGAVGAGTVADLAAAERAQLRDRARAERRTLRALKLDLGELWWERLRLGADGLFARQSASFLLPPPVLTSGATCPPPPATLGRRNSVRRPRGVARVRVGQEPGRDHLGRDRVSPAGVNCNSPMEPEVASNLVLFSGWGTFHRVSGSLKCGLNTEDVRGMPLEG